MAPPELKKGGRAAFTILIAAPLVNSPPPQQNNTAPIDSTNLPMTTSPSLNRRAS